MTAPLFYGIPPAATIRDRLLLLRPQCLYIYIYLLFYEMKMLANLLNFKLIFGARHLLVWAFFFVEYVVVGPGCMFETMKQRHNGIGCAFFADFNDRRTYSQSPLFIVQAVIIFAA